MARPPTRGPFHPSRRRRWCPAQAFARGDPAQDLDVRNGRIVTSSDGRTSVSIEEAARDVKQAVEEKYKLCDETLSKLLQWISEIEDKLANQDTVKEDVEQLRKQIIIMKEIKEDLESHNRSVSSCLDQIRQVVLTGSNVLFSDKESTLEKNSRFFRTRFDKALDRIDKLVKRLIGARDELTKFKNELTTFSIWLDKARSVLEEEERSLSDLNKLSSSTDTTHLRGRAHQLMMEVGRVVQIEGNLMMRHELRVAEEQRELSLNNSKRRGKKVSVDFNVREYCTMCDLNFYGTLSTHRKSEKHHQLKIFLHPRCFPCLKEFPSRIEYDEHCLTPAHMKNAVQREEQRKNKKKDKLAKGEAEVRTAEDEEKDVCHDAKNEKEEDSEEQGYITDIIENITEKKFKIPSYKY
ncbi:uncharacterized protein LOC112467793 [Temnothorax curvispinosus]|uniref:Uncharacterized protein LOC112453675 n=1 Tax=Temnothorax curvispinosus TaxID=300111 RepID=A0A6J1PMG5_9HYME|nr:uncharacterized protein LOC112453675 [Temnothorax curvispinosus]XP_024892379.1 uncharacterized protein LOC112467793 [Temnothorax curvispinosus]